MIDLLSDEMCRRKDFYKTNKDAEPANQEDCGNDLSRWYILPEDPISLALSPSPDTFNSNPEQVNIMLWFLFYYLFILTTKV